MNFLELQDTLQNLTNQEIFLADFAKILDCGKANISKRAKNNSEITVSELQKIEKYYGVSIYKPELAKEPELLPDFNLGIQYDFDQWGKRMLMLQVASKILDSKEFAKFLDISEKRLNEFVMKNKYPNGEELLKIKTRFSKTNFDWLLFGHIE